MADQPTNLSIDDLAGKIKAKYPAYSDVDNTTLVQKVVAKHPEYHATLNPEAQSVAMAPMLTAQAGQAIKTAANATPLGAAPTDLVDQYKAAQASGQVPSATGIEKLAPVIGAAGGAGLLAEGGSGIVAGAMKALGAGAGAAVGSVGEQAVAGGKVDPTEALKTGAVYGAGEGVASALSSVAKWIGASKTIGARLLDKAAAKGADTIVNISPETDKLMDEIVTQSKRGGGNVPKAVSDLLERLGPSTKDAADANPGPLLYPEARDFASNAGDRAFGETSLANKNLNRLVKLYARSLDNDVQAAANSGGFGTEHKVGMQQYASASSRNRAAATAGTLAAKGVAALGGVGASGYAGYELLKKFGVVGK